MFVKNTSVPTPAGAGWSRPATPGVATSLKVDYIKTLSTNLGEAAWVLQKVHTVRVNCKGGGIYKWLSGQRRGLGVLFWNLYNRTLNSLKMVF